MALSARVTPSEYTLLSLARGLVGPRQFPFSPEPRTAPEPLGQEALRVLRETLARGWPAALARCGGVGPTRRPRAGRIEAGRAVSLSPDVRLHFSDATLTLLRWLAQGAPDGLRLPPLTAADELLVYLAAARLVDAAHPERAEPLSDASPLVTLAFPLAGSSEPDFGRYIVDPGGRMLLESVQRDLALRLVDTVTRVGGAESPAAVMSAAARAEAVLSLFSAAAGSAGREDLLTFVMWAGGALVDDRVTAATFARRSFPDAPLSEQQAARSSAGFLLRALAALEARARAWGASRPGSPGFHAERACLAEWTAAVGPAKMARARSVLATLESPPESPAQEGARA